MVQEMEKILEKVVYNEKCWKSGYVEETQDTKHYKDMTGTIIIMYQKRSY